MLNILTTKKYNKSFGKKDAFIQRKAIERIKLFQRDQFNILLNNHSLNGKHKDDRSFNVTGDYRILFYYSDENTAVLSDIGTHPELYG